MEINKIYNEECVAGMKRLPDNCIDLVVTSPPYNLGIKYDVYNDKRDLQEYYVWSEKWIGEVYRVLKPDGRFCLNHYLSCGTSALRFAPSKDLHCICIKVGFKHHGDAIWNDITLTKRTAWGSWVSASAPYINSPFETIEILYKDRWKKDHKGKSTISDKEFMEACSGVWNIAPEKKRDGCPAPFPKGIPRRCINLLSYTGDLVLDPFNGGGTTTIVAKETGRNYIGFDISENYCKIAETELSKVQFCSAITENI